MMNRELAEHYVWADHCDGWHFLNDPNLSVIYERMPSGTSEVRHFHQRSRQFFFVLVGTATLEVGGARHLLSPHEGFEIPPGIPHQMLNESDEDVEFLVISQPHSHGDRVLIEE